MNQTIISREATSLNAAVERALENMEFTRHILANAPTPYDLHFFVTACNHYLYDNRRLVEALVRVRHTIASLTETKRPAIDENADHVSVNIDTDEPFHIDDAAQAYNSATNFAMRLEYAAKEVGKELPEDIQGSIIDDLDSAIATVKEMRGAIKYELKTTHARVTSIMAEYKFD